MLVFQGFQSKKQCRTIMTGIFKLKDHSYDLTENNSIKKQIFKLCKYGKETILNLGGKTLG